MLSREHERAISKLGSELRVAKNVADAARKMQEIAETKAKDAEDRVVRIQMQHSVWLQSTGCFMT